MQCLQVSVSRPPTVVMRSGNGKIESAFKMASVWSLYFLLAIILIAAFCLVRSGCKTEEGTDEQISSIDQMAVKKRKVESFKGVEWE